MPVAGAVRKVVLRGGAAAGAVVLGTAYYQRVPASYRDHTSAWSEGIFTRAYRTFALPVVVQVDPETAHTLALQAARAFQALRLLAEPSGSGPLDWLLRPAPSSSTPSGPRLAQELFGGRLSFESPFGIAAGFDKNAVLVPLYRLGAIPGLGFSEVGSVSALPAPGNARPRCWRIPSDEAVINFMGLNNEGSEAIAARLDGFAYLGRAASPVPGAAPRAPVGVNIAKTHSPSIMGDAAVEDFVTSFQRLAPRADFVVLNVSCPNTAEGKTFEEPATLQSLLQAIAQELPKLESLGSRPPPILVKLVAPVDAAEGKEKLRGLLDVIQKSGVVDGLVLSNTVLDRNVPLSEEGRAAAAADGVRGGLSGPPLAARSTAAIRVVYELTGGRIPIVGVGGVDSAEAAYAKIRAGASLVEVYTGVVYKGPGLLSDLHVGLRRLLERDGFSSISEAVGVDAAVAA